VLFNVGLPDRPLSLLGALVIGAAAFAAMGLGLSGYVRSAEGSSAVVNFVYLPMAIISGTFFSPDRYPGFLQAIADVLPLTYFTKLIRDVMVRDHHLLVGGELDRGRARVGSVRPGRRSARFSLAAARVVTVSAAIPLN